MISLILPDSVPLAIWYSEGCRSRRVIPIRCCRRGVREPRNSSSVPVVPDRGFVKRSKKPGDSPGFLFPWYKQTSRSVECVRRRNAGMQMTGLQMAAYRQNGRKNDCRLSLRRNTNKKHPFWGVFTIYDIFSSLRIRRSTASNGLSKNARVTKNDTSMSISSAASANTFMSSWKRSSRAWSGLSQRDARI